MTNYPDVADHLDEQFEGSGGTIRIPGQNGELVIFHSVLLIDRLVEREELALGLDIIVDEPSRCVRYRNRPIVPTDLVYLRRFLNAAMTELHPEASVQAFHSESAGLVISVVGSSNLSVQLEVGVTEYLDDPDPDIDRIRLDVNRAALDEPVDIADSMIDVFVPINERGRE